MRLAGLFILVAGLLLLLGSLGYLVYSMLSAFSAAHDVDQNGSTPGISVGTSMTIFSAGLITTIAGIVVLAYVHRSGRY